MKTRKTLSTFLIAWTLLLSQAHASNANSMENVRLNMLEAEAIDHGRHEVGCTEVGGVGLNLPPEFANLVIENHESNCSLARAISKGRDDNGSYDSIGFCTEIEKMKNSSESGCIIPSMDPASIKVAIEDVRKGHPELREKEIENKAKALRKHAEELNATATLQFGLSTDIEAVEHLFKMVWQEGKEDPQRREIYKNLFDLGDDFFEGSTPESSGYSVEQFISSAFQCLPYSSGNDSGKGEGYTSGIRMAKPSCEEAHLPEGSQSLLEAAEEKMMNECNEQGENCFFSGATQADGIFNELHKYIGGKIGGLGSFYQGNPAFLAENLEGLQHLEQVHAMLSHIARDSSEPTITENLRSIIGNAKRGGNAWDPSTGIPPAEIVDQMRTSAFNSSVSLVLREADGLSGDSEEAKAKREKFLSILEKLKEGGENLKDGNNYTIDGLYERYEELGLGPTLEDREIAGYISMVATGQKHADNLIQREIQMAKTVDMVSSGNGERGPESRGFGRATNGVVDMNRLRQFRRQVGGVLKRARENPNTSVETVQTQLRGIFGDDSARSGLWASMAHFESLKDNSGNPAEALAFGARGVMSVMGKSLKSVLEDESRNAGISGLTDERKLKLTQMEALKNMAMRSAQTCNKLKQPSYKQGKFCTPLQDPDYANEALSNYMKGKAEGFLRRGEIDINEQKVVLSSALVYCAPILNDYEERDLIQGRHYDPLSPAYAQHKFNQCQKRTRTIFCSSSDSACNLNDPALKEQQIALFGQTCNSESLNSEDHRTRIGAAIANGDLDLISGDVTRPNIESGKVSINGTYNMEVSKKEGTNMTAIAQSFRGTTYGYTNKSGYKAKKGNGFIGASSNAQNDRLPDHFKSPMDSKIAASKPFSGENRQISIDSGGENFVPVDTITGDMADRVLETMTGPEEKDSELAKLLERLSSLEERLTKGADENEKGDEKDASLTALENEIKELRERLAKSSELKDRLATIDPSPRSEPTPTVIDPSDFVGDPGSVRNNKGRGRSIASVPSAGTSTAAPVNTNVQDVSGGSSPIGGSTVRDGDFSPSASTAFFDGDEVTLSRADLSGVTKSSLIKLVSNGTLKHDDVIKFVSDAARNLAVGESTRYVVTTEDGQILVYTPKMINGQIEVEVSEYNPDDGGLDIAGLDTIEVATTAEDEAASALRKPASEDEPAGRVYREFQLDCVLDGTCIGSGSELPTPLIQN